MPTTAIRAALSKRLAEVLQRNARVASRLRHTTELPDDWIDRAPLLADEDVLAELDAGAREEALALRNALTRLEAGTYGVCTVCGERIAAGRLHSRPTAATCVDCAA